MSDHWEEALRLAVHDELEGLVTGMQSTKAFLRSLPNTLWQITVFLATIALFAQIAVALARSDAVSIELLLTEFIFTLVFLSLPLGIAWYGRQQKSLWYSSGGLFLLLAMWKIFFF